MSANSVLIIISVLLTNERGLGFFRHVLRMQSKVDIRNEYFPGLNSLYHSVQTLLNPWLWNPEKVSQIWLQFVIGSSFIEQWNRSEPER